MTIVSSYSPSSIEFDELFACDDLLNDEEVNYINPDEFLNLDEFREIKNEPQTEIIDTYESYDFTYTNHSPPQLTPPISPQPNSIVIDSSSFQHSVNLIPIRTFSQNTPQSVRKVKTIIPKPSSSSDSDSNVIVTNLKKSTSPIDRALIKQQRQIRNRESAIQSRNKKKEYVQTLEEQNVQLRKENTILKNENVQLKEKLSNFNALTCRCASSLKRKLPSKNVTVMMAVLFMVGVNILPFGNFVFKNSLKKPIDSHQFAARHLLYVENSSFVSNETNSVEVEDEAVVYLNQTEQVRQFNIDNIRRWIPEPDLFNVSYMKKDFDFNPDPLQEKLTKMYEKSREQSQKYVKNSKKRSPKKKTIIGPMQLYDSKNNVIKLNEFFDEINRKDDTFYVFSFKADHLLLPAIDNSYNFSQIKMNLIMPRNNSEFSNLSFNCFRVSLETLISIYRLIVK